MLQNHPILRVLTYIGLGILTGSFIVTLILFYDSYHRAFRKVKHTLFPWTLPDWYIAMNVTHSELWRPRFLSLHTLATITGRDDLLELAKEMKDSREVNATFCSTVRAPVFCLKGRGTGNSEKVWDELGDFVKRHPYPEIKGFQSGDGYWTSGYYGIGSYVSPETAMTEPFVKQDYKYANKIIKALRKKKRFVGIPEYEVK